MCRMALLDRQGIQYIHNKLGGLDKFFNFLVEQNGGHGNGLACIYPTYASVKKGVKLTVKQIVTNILENQHKLNYVIFHSRLASVGQIENQNCHPFVQGNTLLAMNGTEKAFKELYQGVNTDTESILKFMKEYNLDIYSTLSSMRSSFIGVNENKVFCIRNTRPLKIINSIDKKGLIIASDFPKEYYTKTTVYNSPAMWKQGDEIHFHTLTKATQEQKYIQAYNYNPHYYNPYQNYNVQQEGWK